MSETKKEFLNMTTAFYVSGNYPSKESVKEFVEWLAEEGYQEIRHEYANMPDMDILIDISDFL